MAKFSKEALRKEFNAFVTEGMKPGKRMSNECLLRELPILFRRLDSKGLIPKEMDYAIFERIAMVKYMESLLAS